MEFKNLSELLVVPVQNIVKVTTEADVVSLLNERDNSGQHIVYRPFGGRHSWAPSVTLASQTRATKTILLDTSELKDRKGPQMFQIGGEHYIRMGPGVTQGEMANAAALKGRALPMTGAVQQSIRVGGFLAAGCHGTGDSPPVSEYVVAIRIVLQNRGLVGHGLFGPVIFTNLNNLPDNITGNAPVINNFQLLGWKPSASYAEASIMDFVRVHFGCLGIVTEYIIATVTQFYVNAADEVVPLERVLPRPDVQSSAFADMFTKYDYLELFYHPFNKMVHDLPVSGDIMLKHAVKFKGKPIFSCRRMTDPLDFRKLPLRNLSSDLSMKAVVPIFNASDLNPEVLELTGRLVYGRSIDKGCCGFTGSLDYYLCRKNIRKYQVPFNEFSLYERTAPENIFIPEMEIPIDLSLDPTFSCFRRAWWFVVDLVKEYAQRKEYPLNIILHCRFNRRSSSILSSCYNVQNDIWFATLEFASVARLNIKEGNYESQLQKFTNQVLYTWLHVNDDLIKQGTDRAYLTPRPHFSKVWFDNEEARMQVGRVFKDNILEYESFRHYVDCEGHFNGGLVPELVSMANAAI